MAQTTKKATKKATAPSTAPSAADKVALTPAERAEADAEAIATDIAEFEATVTQREWLLVTGKLDRSRAQVQADGSLRLLALAWVRQKREHGGASWDRLLECTDKELLELHGFKVEELAEAAGEPAEQE